MKKSPKMEKCLGKKEEIIRFYFDLLDDWGGDLMAGGDDSDWKLVTN